MRSHFAAVSDDEILSSRLRTDFHVTSGRRPPCRRRGCLSSPIVCGQSKICKRDVSTLFIPILTITFLFCYSLLFYYYCCYCYFIIIIIIIIIISIIIFMISMAHFNIFI